MRKKPFIFKAIGVLVLWLWACCAFAQNPHLIGVRIKTEADKTQLILIFNHTTPYKIFALSSPARVVVDLPKVELHVDLKQLPTANTPVSTIRSSIKADGDLRIVFDLKQVQHATGVSLQALPNSKVELIVQMQDSGKLPQDPKKLALNKTSQTVKPTKSSTSTDTLAADEITPAVKDHAKEKVASNNDADKDADAKLTIKKDKNTVVSEVSKIDAKINAVQDTPTASLVATQSSLAVDDPIASFAETKVNEVLPPAGTGRDVIVVIDPGHGGKDPGAEGFRRTHEKDVVLAIAKTLKRQLEKQPGIRAVLTRDEDYFIELRQRLEIARKNKADMFVAVHADAFSNPYSFGSSVFALSERGASSEAARWLAEKENYSELGGVNLDDKDNVLRSVLIDLSQNYTIGASLQLGSSVLNQLGKITRLHRGHVEQARFVVLKSPDIPSILVETGFISNPGEEAKLRNPQYQEELALAIMSGIRHYFWMNPPIGTSIAEQRAAASRYTTVAGDTLPAIAKRYSVSVQALKKYNQLTSNSLRVGQVLRIPATKDS